MKGVYQILKKSVKSTFFLTRCTPSVFFKKGLGKSSKDTKKIIIKGSRIFYPLYESSTMVFPCEKG